MELTAKTLHDVTFGAKVRGYDPAEVDDFLAAVAEGVEELHERLRRATERATKAEQDGGTGVVTESAPTSADIGKVWERAAAAADAAVAEARADAERLIEDARQRADAQLKDAQERAEAQLKDAEERSQAQLREAQERSEEQLRDAQERSETQLSDARRESETQLQSARQEAESAVSTARNEAARIAEEAQGQLRSEIAQLEQARQQLQEDVSSLSGYLDGELAKVRATLHSALSTLDSHSPSGSAPEVSNVVTPPAPAFSEPEMAAPASDDVPMLDEVDSMQADAMPMADSMQMADSVEAIETPEPDGHPFQDGEVEWENTEPEWEEPAPATAAGLMEDEQITWPDDVPVAEDAQGDAMSSNGAGEVDDADPFLAELRRAVNEDEPVGPRVDDGTGDPSIDRLYSSDDDDDDKSGFFRRKK